MPEEMPALTGRARMVPIASTAIYAGTTITLIGLELYADRLLADFVVFPARALQEPRLLIDCRNDRGGRYLARMRRGSSAGPARHRWALTYGFAPAPSARARVAAGGESPLARWHRIPAGTVVVHRGPIGGGGSRVPPGSRWP